MADPLLELRRLRKTYGTQTAVDDVSLALHPGEFLSLLGPSGSGKTTTLGMIAGLIEPSGGEIMLQSRPIKPLPPYRRNIGVVFQNYALFPHMTVAANIAFPLEMRRLPRAEIGQLVAKVLSLVDLAGYEARLPAQLSGGQQQRVALARAVVFEPPLLLMDEPLGALDKKLREQMQLEIKHLHQRVGISVVYVTHDQDEALTMSDRIAVFNRGRIEQIGTPTEVYDRPVTRFVADFVGETNLLPGVATELAGGYCRITGAPTPLRARPAPDIVAGRPVVVAVRPERTRLGPAGSASSGVENRLDATVVELIYLGRSRKYVVEAGGLRMTAAQQIEGGNAIPFAPGDRVSVSWDADDATAVPED
jgi:putative spermidine/putrescine transport system ATP-binding protein